MLHVIVVWQGPSANLDSIRREQSPQRVEPASVVVHRLPFRVSDRTPGQV